MYFTNHLKFKAVSFIILLVGTIFGVQSVNAQNQSIANFTLTTNFNIVADINQPTSELLAKKISSYLRKKDITTSTISNITSHRNIIINHVSSIENFADKDAFSLYVTKDNIYIKFTSSTSSFWAYQALIAKLGSKQNIINKLSKKNKYLFYATSIASNEGEESGTDLIRFVTTSKSMAELKERINKAQSANISTLYIEILTTKGCKLKCNTIDIFNPNQSYISDGSITISQLEELNEYAKSLDITLIPIIDLSSGENNPLSTFTGHPIHTAEGLRFSKALLKEVCDGTTLDTVCIGYKIGDETIKTKYIEPLVELLHHNGKKVIAL